MLWFLFPFPMAVLYGIQCLPLVCVRMRGRLGDKQSVFNFLSLVNCSRLTLQWKFGMVSWNWQEKYQKIFFLFSCRVLFWGRECCDRVQQHTYASIPSVSYSSPPKIIPSKKKKTLCPPISQIPVPSQKLALGFHKATGTPPDEAPMADGK